MAKNIGADRILMAKLLLANMINAQFLLIRLEWACAAG
jgi:hypothetical protein